MKSVYQLDLPEISDEFAKGLGAFENLATLKENIKQGIINDKTDSEKQRRRSAILEKISHQCDIQLPDSVVEYEKQQLLERFKNTISQQHKLSFAEYLQSVKKTEQEIKESYHKEAEKRLKEFLILQKIGKNENISVSEEELKEELQRLVKDYDPDTIKKIDIYELREYTKGAIFNEKVFKFFEELS